MRYIIITLLLCILSFFAATLLGDYTHARRPIRVRIKPLATLEGDNRTVMVHLHIACSPEIGGSPETFVYLVQNGTRSEFADIPLVCGGQSQRYVVPVTSPGAPFHQGSGSASAYVRVIDQATGKPVAGGDIQPITIR